MRKVTLYLLSGLYAELIEAAPNRWGEFFLGQFFLRRVIFLGQKKGVEKTIFIITSFGPYGLRRAGLMNSETVRDI